METKQIIRVEGVDGIGMFRYHYIDGDGTKKERSWVPCEKLGLGERHYRFSDPESDGIRLNLNSKEWFCAYKSVDQFKEWVLKDEIKTMHEHGFKVFLLDVTEYQEGVDQICFTKESITLKKDITQLFL